jgi:hypothetical protein
MTDKVISQFEKNLNDLLRLNTQQARELADARSEIERLTEMLDEHHIAHEAEGMVSFNDFEKKATQKLKKNKNWHSLVEVQLGLSHGTISQYKVHGEAPHKQFIRLDKLVEDSGPVAPLNLDQKHLIIELANASQKVKIDDICRAVNAKFPGRTLTRNDVNNFLQREGKQFRA